MKGEMEQRLFNIKPSELTYTKKGVLWLEKKPHYIVELVKENNLSYVVVYGVHPGTESNPQPLAQEVTETKGRFSDHTRLGQIANRLFPAKRVKKWIPKDPLFVAPVIPHRRNTFTGVYEDGFFEREADRVSVIQGEKRLIRGNNTGVFIGLSSIVWEDKVKIPTDSLIKALNNYKHQGMFYDLQGNNNSSSNPLSTYYKEESDSNNG